MSTDTAMRLQTLTRRYGDLTAVDNLSLDVNRGEILGFLGPNGAGKSTTMHMMTGALRPTSGQVLVGAGQVAVGTGTLSKRIGFAPQGLVLWERLTCVENLSLMACMYGVHRSDTHHRATELLHAMGLSEKADARVKSLSGGMKKRLNLAMALIHDPEIIVLDEPITGLDPQSRLLVSDHIRGLCRERGKTVVLSTHLMEVASDLADRLAIIDHGKLLVHDRLETIMKNLGRGDVVELALGNPEESAAAVAMTRDLEGIENVTERAGRIRFQALGAVAMLPEIFQRLNGIGAEIENLSLRPNSLEDIFISLTGRGLRD